MKLLVFLSSCFMIYNSNVAMNSKNEDHKSDNDKHGNKVTQQIEAILKSHSYELSIKPNNKGRPVKVGLFIIIESITDISEKNMDLTFTLSMHETWRDERLVLRGNRQDSVVVPSRIIEKLWVPDLFILGSKSSFVHKTAVNNVIMRLYNDGTINYKVKITTTVACQMNLYNFPLDIEECSLNFRSLGYTTNEVILAWKSGIDDLNIFMDKKLVKNMPKFQLVHHKFHSFNVSMRNFQVGNDSKSQLKVSFELKRYLLSVFFQSYFPAMIMVALAGLGMWIDPKSVPARIALGVTSVLTISTIITGLKSSLPKVSYLTAMDIYLWVCFLFVFSTVLEFCVLNFFLTKRAAKFCEKRSELEVYRKRKLNKNLNSQPPIQNKWTVPSQPQTPNHRNYSTFSSSATSSPMRQSDLRNMMVSDENNLLDSIRKLKKSPRSMLAPEKGERNRCLEFFHLRDIASLDVYFRVGYFITFIAFNLVYWTYYVTATKHDVTEDDY